MASMVQQLSDLEIQFLVLLSLTLQIFLFFFSGLRRCITNKLFRAFIWLAYLGADLVAVYIVGILSRHQAPRRGSDTFGTADPLPFFWAPFLLIHLGGQDTITAFSTQDNSLWLRHLLNLLVQVTLALYVFWMSTIRNYLLAPAIFVFATGIIKYGERTWALKSASQEGLGSSPKDKSPSQKGLESSTNEKSLCQKCFWCSIEDAGMHMPVPTIGDDIYASIVCAALRAVPSVRDIFAGRTVFQMTQLNGLILLVSTNRYQHMLKLNGKERSHQRLIKIIELELGMIFDELYTKGRVLRRRRGLILRCVSLVSIIIGFVLFLTSYKERYNRANVAITYVLFIGGFCLDICAVFMMIMSPWTWAFLKAQSCDGLARMSWQVLSKTIWAENSPMWSNSMGQYNYVSSCVVDKKLWAQLIGKIMNLVGAAKLWRNYRYTTYANAEKALECLVQRVEPFVDGVPSKEGLEQWSIHQCSGLEEILCLPFEQAILILHLFTDLILHDPEVPDDGETGSMCKQLSDYMVYLMVVHPSMLPVSGAAKHTLAELFKSLAEQLPTSSDKGMKMQILDLTKTYRAPEPQGNGSTNRTSDTHGAGPLSRLYVPKLHKLYNYVKSQPSNEKILSGIKEMWIRLLVYAASKCPAEVHAEQLGDGGQLLTILWLVLARLGIGDVSYRRVDLIRPSNADDTTWSLHDRFPAFDFKNSVDPTSPG